ncbi:MAG TPA: MFS transporter, partial [Syntrophobacteraceae bacterium]|nr:MFS transporter [Syntrophobacteraceae bacterium]
MRPYTEAASHSGDISWLALLCLARMGFSFVFTAYSAALPLLQSDWGMSATQAGMIQSAWHLGFLISLFLVGFAGDRFGAKKTYLYSSVAAGISALIFAVYASDFLSGMLLYGIAGLCSGGSYTPGLTLVAERFSPATRGRAMGFYLGA